MTSSSISCGEKMIDEPVAQLLIQLARILLRIERLGVVVHDVCLLLRRIQIDVADESILPAHVPDEPDSAGFMHEEAGGYEIVQARSRRKIFIHRYGKKRFLPHLFQGRALKDGVVL